MILTWFTAPARSWTWFGQTGETLALIIQGGTSAVASVVGPPGPPGASPSGGFVIDDGTATADGVFTMDDGAA